MESNDHFLTKLYATNPSWDKDINWLLMIEHHLRIVWTSFLGGMRQNQHWKGIQRYRMLSQDTLTKD